MSIERCLAFLLFFLFFFFTVSNSVLVNDRMTGESGAGCKKCSKTLEKGVLLFFQKRIGKMIWH